MNLCYVVGAGEMQESFRPDKSDFVIAADGGLMALGHLHIEPDMIVGDFDSLGKRPVGENVVALPVEKDDTDMAVGVRLGWEKGFRTFLLYGGTGGREDHTFANIQLLHRIANKGGQGFLVGNGFVRTAIVNSSLHLEPKMQGLVSIFSLTDDSFGVTVNGLAYELFDATLSSDTPLGVSNSFTGKAVDIRVRKGALLVMWEGDSPLSDGE